MMRKTKFGKIGTILCMLLASVLIFSLAACDDTSGGELTLSKTTATVAVGGTTTVNVTSATSDDIVWSVDKSDIATVAGSGTGNKLGTITGVADGTAVVTAKAGELSATCTVTVSNSGSIETSVTIKLDGTAVSGVQYIHLGDDVTYTATSESGTISWESSNTSVATVANGKVTAKAAGTAVIKAKVSDSDYATITVEVVAPTDIAFSAEDSFSYGWRYWNGDGDVAISSCYYYTDNNEVHVTFKMESNCKFYSLQLFYKDKTTNKDHSLNMTVVSPVAGGITINGQANTLVEGDNKIFVESYAKSAVCIAFGVENISILDGDTYTFIFKDINITTPNAEVELQAPTFSYANDTEIVTITDTINNKIKVDGYEIGFFEHTSDIEPNTIVAVTNGQAIDLVAVPTGNYIMRIRAVSNSATVINSDWSDTYTNIEWINNNTPLKTDSTVTDTWYYFKDGATKISHVFIDNNDVIQFIGIDGNSTETWSVQLCYNSTKTITGMTVTVCSTTAGAIGINLPNKDLHLTAVDGEDYYEATYTYTCSGKSVVICLGTNQEAYGNTTNNLKGDVSFKIEFTYAD